MNEIYRGLAVGAACAVALTGCSKAETSRIPLSTYSVAAVNAMGKQCAQEIVSAKGARSDVVPTVVGSTVVLEMGAAEFTYAGPVNVTRDKILDAINHGTLQIVSWENPDGKGSSANVERNNDGLAMNLVVDPSQGTDAGMIIKDACESSRK